MSQTIETTTVTINAFGYTHEFDDAWNAEEIEILSNAPYITIISGDDDLIEDFCAAELPMDSTLFWTEAGEALVFGYEEISEEALELLSGVLGISWETEDRSDDTEEAAA